MYGRGRESAEESSFSAGLTQQGGTSHLSEWGQAGCAERKAGKCNFPWGWEAALCVSSRTPGSPTCCRSAPETSWSQRVTERQRPLPLPVRTPQTQGQREEEPGREPSSPRPAQSHLHVIPAEEARPVAGIAGTSQPSLMPRASLGPQHPWVCLSHIHRLLTDQRRAAYELPAATITESPKLLASSHTHVPFRRQKSKIPASGRADPPRRPHGEIRVRAFPALRGRPCSWLQVPTSGQRQTPSLLQGPLRLPWPHPDSPG